MSRSILVLNGHPDPRPERFCAALADAYGHGASLAGHRVNRIDLGALDLPLIRSRAEFETGEPPENARRLQSAILEADHLVLVFPLWLGGVPAVTKGVLEQVFRYGFALGKPGSGEGLGRLGGRSARLIVTMGMPSAFFRLAFDAAGLTALSRGVFRLSGFNPVRRTVFGEVEGSADRRNALLRRMGRLGAAAR